MAEKNLKARIQQKHDFEINWQKATNFIPKPGELIIYDAEVDINGNVLTLSDGSSVLPEGRSTPYSFARFKIGDGINVVTSLPFANFTKVSQLENDAKYITADALEDLGAGDMLKEIYDTNDDGIVDLAEDAEKLGGLAANEYVRAEYHQGDDITDKTVFIVCQKEFTGSEEDSSTFEVARFSDEDYITVEPYSSNQVYMGHGIWENGQEDAIYDDYNFGVKCYKGAGAITLLNEEYIKVFTTLPKEAFIPSTNGVANKAYQATVANNAYKLNNVSAHDYALKTDIPTEVSAFTNDAGYLTSYTETDPTVPDWAKASSKPAYTKSEVGLGNVDNVKQYSASNPPPYPVTSVNGKTGAVALSAADLGLSGAMRFLGSTTTVIFDGSSTGTVSIGGSNITAAVGNVVLYNGSEYVWDGAQWEELGSEGSFKLKQTAVSDPGADGEAIAFIDSIAQDENGIITATKKNFKARTIDGVSFNGSADVSHFAVCATPAATAAKTVTLNGFELKVGAKVTVKFNYTNSATSPTLNVNDTGAYPIIYAGASIAAYPVFGVGALVAAMNYEFVFTGANYELVGGLHVNSLADTSKNRIGYVKPDPLATADITWTGGVGTVNNSAKAVADEDGNNIKETYATKTEIPQGVYVGSGEMPENSSLQVDTEDGEEFIIPEVLQTTGTSTEDTMSQKAITDILLDKQQLVPEFANSVEECTDTSKMYVLPDGFIYAYIYTEVVEGDDYTNLADKTSSDWLSGYRTSSSGITAASGYDVTNFLGDGVTTVGDMTIYYKNATMSSQRLCFYNANKEMVYICYPTVFSDYEGFDNTATEGRLFIDRQKNESLNTTAVYVRLCLISGDTAPIITLNEEITDATVVKKYAWTNTGHAFVPADYEDEIVAVAEAANKNAVDIIELKEVDTGLANRLTTLEEKGSATNDDLPAYWQEYLAGKIETIKILQDNGGKDCFSFVVITDMHYEQNLAKLAPKLAKKISDECGIKYILILGDSATRNGILHDLDYINNEWDDIENMVSPIRDKLLMTDGNHDGSYGATDGDGDGVIDDVHGSGNSAFNFTPQKKYNRIKRKVSLIEGVTFDESGCGYYADDKNAKIRYIVLSTHNNKYEENEDGSSKYSNMMNFRYGQSQFDLVINALKTLEDGWSVLVASHVPLDRSGETLHWGATARDDDGYVIEGEVECWVMADVLNAFVDKIAYAGSFTGTQDGFDTISVNVDFTNAKGTLIGYFGGHLHKDGAWDNTYTWNGRLKQCNFWTITTRCDGKNENDSTLLAERIAGTVTEQSFDVFTVNTSERKIYATKIGAGTDRVISY